VPLYRRLCMSQVIGFLLRVPENGTWAGRVCLARRGRYRSC
jgi:hypothetical protein